MQRKCLVNLLIQADSGSASIPCLSIKVLFFSIVSWVQIFICIKCFIVCTAGISVPKYVDTVTPQYKPKFDALVRTDIQLLGVFFTLFELKWQCFVCYVYLWVTVGRIERGRGEIPEGIWAPGERDCWSPRAEGNMIWLLTSISSLV